MKTNEELAEKLTKKIIELIDNYNGEELQFENFKIFNLKKIEESNSLLECGKGFTVFSSEEELTERRREKGLNDSYPQKHRYCYYEKFKTSTNNGPTAFYILFNPSNATPEFDDATVQNCRLFATEDKCKNMFIVNLYSERSTKSKYINTLNNSFNICFLNKLLKYYSMPNVKIIKAWGFGKENKYKKTIEQLDFGTEYYILAIKEEATYLNHHPSSNFWKSIGGIKYAEIKKCCK